MLLHHLISVCFHEVKKHILKSRHILFKEIFLLKKNYRYYLKLLEVFTALHQSFKVFTSVNESIKLSGLKYQRFTLQNQYFTTAN